MEEERNVFAEQPAEEEQVAPQSAAEYEANAFENAEELLKKLAAAEAEAADMKRRLYSVSAEYENYRKRTALTRSQSYAEGRADVITKLFPVGDNLDRALLSCRDEMTAQGIRMIQKAFEKLLEEESVSVICPVGEPFDAEKCEAIMAIEPQGGEESGIVKEVYLKGYEQNGQVLRFAQVTVTK